MTSTNGNTSNVDTSSVAGDNSNKTSQITAPVILWAQRADKLFLTLQIQDCKSPDLKLEKDKLYFKGKSDSIQKDADHSIHEVTLEFFKPINVDESKYDIRARGIEFVIIKEESSWWPRLLKDSTKRHWLKIDFPKWKDEDDSDDEQGMGMGMGGLGGQPDFGDFMQQFGSMSGGAAGGEGEEEFDSDDDDTEQNPPDLE